MLAQRLSSSFVVPAEELEACGVPLQEKAQPHTGSSGQPTYLLLELVNRGVLYVPAIEQP